VRHAARCKYGTQKIAILAPSHNFVGLYLLTCLYDCLFVCLRVCLCLYLCQWENNGPASDATKQH